MSDTCLTCGNLIMEPGSAWGYSGPICQCIEEPRIRKRSSQNLGITVVRPEPRIRIGDIEIQPCVMGGLWLSRVSNGEGQQVNNNLPQFIDLIEKFFKDNM